MPPPLSLSCQLVMLAATQEAVTYSWMSARKDEIPLDGGEAVEEGRVDKTTRNLATTTETEDR